MKKLLFLATYLATFAVFAQAPRIKDDPIARVEFELRKLRDPNTGKIPANIRSRELEFVTATQARLKGGMGDASTVWTHRGPFNVGGRTRALAVDADDENTILAGGVSGGLWRSTDQGANWTKATGVSELQSITCIAQDLNSSMNDTWYYGTGEFSGNSASEDGAFYRGDGIYKSTDNGVTWSVLASTQVDNPEATLANSFQINHNIIVNPSNGDVLVANTNGIQRSQNSGTSWSEVLDNPNGGWSDIVTNSTGSVMYAAIEGSSGGIYQSTNGGTSWSNIKDSGIILQNGNRIVLAIAPSNEDILYLLAEYTFGTSGHILWRFDDNTDTWVNRSSNIPQFGGSVGDFDSQGGYDLIIEVGPSSENFVVIGGTNLYRSTNGFSSSGATDWIGGYSTVNNVSLYPNQHPDQHAFIFLSGTQALSGTDGGVHITSDITADGAGDNVVDWTHLNNGYLTTQVYAVSTGPGDQIMSGFQDNSTWLTTSSVGTVDWTDQFSGDGAYNDFNDDGTTRFMSAQNAQIFRFTYSSANDDTHNGFEQIDPSGGYATSLFITPFYLDPINDEIFYLGGDIDLYVNTQASSSTTSVGWKSIDLPGNSGDVSEFGLTTANMVYVGTDVGEVYKVENPGNATPTVSNITGPSFPSGYISGIGVNQMNENELIVTFSNYSVRSVWYSDNGGTSWTDISGNLEENLDGSGSGPSVRAARIFGDGLEYFVGTSTGLYSTRTINGSSTSWFQEGSTNIGNVVVNHLDINTQDELIIGTHGNGVYSATVKPNDDMSVTSLDAPTSQAFTGLSDVTVTVTNNGTNAVASFDLALSVNSTPVVTDNVVQALNSDETYAHTFSVQYDFTTPADYEVEIIVTLAGDQVASNDSQIFTISSFAVPTDITISNNQVAELAAMGTTVGNFTTEDMDDTSHSYILISGEGDDDNNSFTITNDALNTFEVFDFETKADYTIRIQTSDDEGNTFAKSFAIEVTDVTGITELESAGITMYPNPVKNRMTLEMVNDHTGEIVVSILGLDGRTVLSKSYQKNSRATNSLVDLKPIAAGHYVITFEYNGKKLTGRLIKE